jgi:molybdate transport system permease protein
MAAMGLLVFLVIPLAGLLSRVSWSSLPSDLAAPEVRTALVLSLVCSLGATLLSLVFGLPLAWLLARTSFPARSLVRALATLPLVLPPVVGGMALLLAFGRNGLVGRWLLAAGFQLPFTPAGAILAETFVAMPFLVLTVEGALRSVDRGYEDVAATLGAGPWHMLTRVTPRLIGPSLLSGAALTWARALGEFGATITFAGNVRGRTQTLPLAVFVALKTRPEAAITLSLVLLAVSVAVLGFLGPRTYASLRRAPDR